MSKERVVTLATDFNSQLDNARAQSRFRNENPDGVFVDVTNSLRAFSITDGAFSLWEYHREFPKGIHVVIVDPGVGTNRRAVALETQNGTFIGPDNGVLYPAASDAGIESAWVLNREKLGAGKYSTFDARDLFVPAAAELSKDVAIKNIATEVSPDDIVQYAFQRNQVVQVDRFGNVKLENDCTELVPGQTELFVDVSWGRVVVPFARTFGDVPTGRLLAYSGSSRGRLELAVNGGIRDKGTSAADVLRLDIDNVLNINPIDTALREVDRNLRQALVGLSSLSIGRNGKQPAVA